MLLGRPKVFRQGEGRDLHRSGFRQRFHREPHLQGKLFLRAIDPLSLNKQGEDEGTRYRTGVYFVTEAQVPGISAALDRCAAALGQPLAVELLPLQNFYRAEEYHQDYLEKNPTGYCHLSPAIFRIAEEA